jgi:hypothetical protein
MMMISTCVVILLSLTSINPVWGASMEVVVAPDSMTVHMNLVLQENSTSLPLVNVYLGSSNSTDVVSHIAPAVQKLVPGASISSLTLHAQTLNSSGTWFLRENYTLLLGGVTSNYGSSIRANLGFVSMDVPDSVVSGGLELNTVGGAYLAKPLRSQGNQSMLYYVNGHQTLTSVIPVTTTVLFHLLDFSWIPSVSSWQNQKDWLGQATTLTFDPGGPRFNLTFGPRTPENTLSKVFMAVYSPSISIVTVPAVAWLDGTFVSFDVSSPAELWMPLVAGLSVITLLSTLFLDRSLTKGQRVKKKKR